MACNVGSKIFFSLILSENVTMTNKEINKQKIHADAILLATIRSFSFCREFFVTVCPYTSIELANFNQYKCIQYNWLISRSILIAYGYTQVCMQTPIRTRVRDQSVSHV